MLEVAYQNFFLKVLLFNFRQVEGREGDREGEKHLSVASRTLPAGDLACIRGICTDWELNPVTLWFVGTMPKPLSHAG